MKIRRATLKSLLLGGLLALGAALLLATPSSSATPPLPPMEGGHRHFDRPARPILPTATPITSPPYPGPSGAATSQGATTSGETEAARSSGYPPPVAATATPNPAVQGDVTTAAQTLRVLLPLVQKAAHPDQKFLTVFALAYIDTPGSWDIDTLQTQLIGDLASATTWHGDRTLSAPMLNYATYHDAVITLNEAPPHRADNNLFDYDAVYQRFDLCAKIQQGLVDEVWIWGSDTGLAAEFVVNGNTYNAIPDKYSVPNCGKTVATFNFRYDLPIGKALHSYGHRIEDTLLRSVASGTSTCDFLTLTGPPPTRRGDVAPVSDAHCVGALAQSDQFAFIARPMGANNNISVCGDVHFPPNILPPWTTLNEFKYDIATTVSSRCLNWQWTTAVAPSTISCSTWGCNERQYQIWWMQHIPGIGNNNKDRNNVTQPNWWLYLWR